MNVRIRAIAGSSMYGLWSTALFVVACLGIDSVAAIALHGLRATIPMIAPPASLCLVSGAFAAAGLAIAGPSMRLSNRAMVAFLLTCSASASRPFAWLLPHPDLSTLLAGLAAMVACSCEISRSLARSAAEEITGIDTNAPYGTLIGTGAVTSLYLSFLLIGSGLLELFPLCPWRTPGAVSLSVFVGSMLYLAWRAVTTPGQRSGMVGVSLSLGCVGALVAIDATIGFSGRWATVADGLMAGSAFVAAGSMVWNNPIVSRGRLLGGYACYGALALLSF